MSFSKFSLLPPELRLAVWKEAIISPSMHVFDVCMPDLDDERAQAMQYISLGKRADAAFKRADTDCTRYNKFKNTVFFDALSGKQDPSMYRWKMALASSCIDALRVASPMAMPGTTNCINSVYLPGPDRRVQYNNEADILYLRFGEIQCLKRAQAAPANSSNTSSAEPDFIENGVLDRQWSNELAVTIRAARRIALDAGHTDALVKVHGNPILYDEMHMLASTMACALEVLYLVDSCSSGGCVDCGHSVATADLDLSGKGLLHNVLNDEVHPQPEAAPRADPTPQKIHGVGKVYTIVHDLEQLGWTDRHPAYIFGKALGEAIREQQADAGAVIFKGVRVLVEEDA